MKDRTTCVRPALRIVATLSLLMLGAGAVHAFGQSCEQHPATPTDPHTGTLDISGPQQVTFDADNRIGASANAASCLGTNCSEFLLTVADPGSKRVRVRLDWTLVTNDYDLQVFDPDCVQVASSGNGTTTFEEDFFTPQPNTTYQVIIVHFTAAPPEEIDGLIELVDPPTGIVQPTRTEGGGIVFSPNGIIETAAGPAPTGKGTVFAPETVRDGEPSVRVDLRGNTYPAGIRGVPAGVDVWRFGPQNFCPRFTFHDDDEFPTGDPADGYVYLGQPDGIFVNEGEGSPDAGGGDIEIATSFPASTTATPALSMVSLTLANITGAASFDRGNNWTPANPVTAIAPPADRQWIAAFGESTVYLYYRTLATLTGLVLQKSIDNGVTYVAGATLANPLGFTPGWIDVDQTPNPDGSVDVYLSGQNSSELAVFHCVDPNPSGVSTISCTLHIVDDQMSHGHIFDPVTVDNAGNVYAAWSNNDDIFYAYSTNKGGTWSSPVQVTSEAAGMPKFNIFPWITAGDDGRVGIVWFGTESPGNANDAEWKAYYAFTPNARAATPDLSWTEVSDHFIHKGNVSQGGFNPLGADENRNLIDFFQVADDPRDGAAVVAWGDDHNDFDGATYFARQIDGPGLVAGTPVTSAPCPPLTPFRDPEVLDFLGDVVSTSDTGVPLPDADILNIDYGSEEEAGNTFLTAEIRIANLLVAPPPERSYRAYFATNSQRGLMDAGNEFFVEVTTANGVPEYWLGVKDRRADGSTEEQQVERIDADQVTSPFTAGAPGSVLLRVNVSRLDWSFTAGGTMVTDPPGVATDGGATPPADGDLIIGLSGRARVATPTSTSVVEETRGGSFIILGEEDGDGGEVTEVECDDEAVTQFGGWQKRTTEGGERYCRNVGNQANSDPSKRPYLELQFPGSSVEVRYDYFTSPRGGFVEVIIDGVSREVINQFEDGSDQSGQKQLTPQSRSYAVAQQVNPHTIRVIHRTDLDQQTRNIAYVDGFAVQEGATGTAASADQEIAFTNTLASGKSIDHKIVASLGTLFLGGVVEPVSAELFGSDGLVVELYNPAGLRIATSSEAVAPSTVSAPTILPGQYTVRVRNTSSRAVSYRASMLQTLVLN